MTGQDTMNFFVDYIYACNKKDKKLNLNNLKL